MLTRRKPLKRTALKRKARKKQPGDDPAYKDWIKTLCCWVCWLKWREGIVVEPSMYMCEQRVILNHQRSPTEPHHAGDHGYAQLPPDRTCIPLCAEHHRLSKDAAHVLGKNFWKHHNLDRDQIIRELQERYDQLNA